MGPVAVVDIRILAVQNGNVLVVAFKGSGSIYQSTGAGWVHRGSSTRAGVSRDWVRSTGIPLSVLRALEWEVEEEY